MTSSWDIRQLFDIRKPRGYNQIRNLITIAQNYALRQIMLGAKLPEGKPLRPNDAIWHPRSGSSLIQAVACRLTGNTPSPHYSDVIMSAMASQITRLTIIYSTVYSGADQWKHQSSASFAFVRGILPVTGEFPAQRTSNAENVSIWRRYHDDHWN